MRRTDRSTRSSAILPAILALCILFVAGRSTAATDVSGATFEDRVKVANKELVLNGAGVRTKAAFKVYAAGLYVPEKKTTASDLLAATGPKRLHVVMLRDTSAEDFGTEVLKGFTDNTDKAARAKLVTQTAALTEALSSVRTLKKGDVLSLDWSPGTGMQVVVNGKQLGQTIADPAFFTAVLRGWLGDRAIDRALKTKLLGAKT